MLVNRLAYSGMAVAAILAIGGLAGCSSGATAAASAQVKPTVITVDSVPASEEGGLYVAAYEGFFAQQGLAVKIKPITGGEAGIPDLQSGKADLVAGNYVSFTRAQMAGKFDGKPASLRIIAAGSELQPGSEALYVMPDSRVKTVASLGKHHARVGLNTPNDVGDGMVDALLDYAGYTLKDIRQVIPAGGFPALLKMLPAGKVDAIWLPEPLGTMAEQEGRAVPVADFDQGSMQNFPFTGYIGATQWVRTHAGTGRRPGGGRHRPRGGGVGDGEVHRDHAPGGRQHVHRQLPADDGPAGAAAGARLDVPVRADGRQERLPDHQHGP